MTDTIPALSVRQPWAWAISRGWKPVENRSWATSYRGPLAIHSAAKWDEQAWFEAREVARLARGQGAEVPRTLADDPLTALGAVLAVVELTGICPGQPCDCGPWAQPGQRHWQLADARPLAEPVPARGRLQLWPWTPAEAA